MYFELRNMTKKLQIQLFEDVNTASSKTLKVFERDVLSKINNKF